jgi:hypothetical protein
MNPNPFKINHGDRRSRRQTQQPQQNIAQAAAAATTTNATQFTTQAPVFSNEDFPSLDAAASHQTTTGASSLNTVYILSKIF